MYNYLYIFHAARFDSVTGVVKMTLVLITASTATTTRHQSQPSATAITSIMHRLQPQRGTTALVTDFTFSKILFRLVLSEMVTSQYAKN